MESLARPFQFAAAGIPKRWKKPNPIGLQSNTRWRQSDCLSACGLDVFGKVAGQVYSKIQSADTYVVIAPTIPAADQPQPVSSHEADGSCPRLNRHR